MIYYNKSVHNHEFSHFIDYQVMIAFYIIINMSHNKIFTFQPPLVFLRCYLFYSILFNIITPFYMTNLYKPLHVCTSYTVLENYAIIKCTILFLSGYYFVLIYMAISSEIISIYILNTCDYLIVSLFA